MAHEDLYEVCLETDVLVWECPECGKLNRDKFHAGVDETYGCNCGFLECDIREFISDIEWND